MAKYNHFKVDLDNKDSTHTKVLSLVGRGNTVLDVGCASGYLSASLKESFDCRVWGLDIDKASLEKAKSIFEDTYLVNLEKDNLSKILGNKKFEVAVLADVLEHLREPKKALENLIPHITKHLVISVPNISHEAVIYELLSGQFNYRSLGLLDNTHIHFFTLETIKNTLEDLGLVIEEVQRTLIPAEASEFKTKVKDFPESIRAYLNSLPHSRDYQYIIKASLPKAKSLGLVKRFIEVHESENKLKEQVQNLKEEKEILLENINQKASETEEVKTSLTDQKRNLAELNELIDWQKAKIRELSGIFYKKKLELDEFENTKKELDELKEFANHQAQELNSLRRETSELKANPRFANNITNLSPLNLLKNKNKKRIHLEQRAPAPETPKIAIFTLSYNSERWIKNYLKAIKKLSYSPENISLHILDNGSKDSSYQLLLNIINNSSDFLFPVLLHKSENNLGFSGGNNFLLKSLSEDVDYVFLLNMDSEIDKDCISHVVSSAKKDASIAMVEAKQLPKEHPKWYNPNNFETGWCSGGGVLIKKEAIDRVGLFDERFFLYCEDVDLSWRMWLSGYRCVFCPEATYHHFTEDLDKEKDLSVQTYYSIRNSFYMHFKYDSVKGIYQHLKNINELIKNEKDPKRKKLFIKAKKSALLNSLRFIKDRLEIQTYPHTPWAVFNGFNYEERREFVDTPDGKRRIIG